MNVKNLSVRLLILATIITCFILVSPLQAQVPGIINYQGRIVDNGTNFNGTGLFEFALVNPAGTTNYWSNDGTAVGQPAAAVSLTVTKGLYAVLLGDTTVSNMTLAIPMTVFANPSVLLRVWFNDGVNGFQQLTPDQRLGSVGYALMAASVPAGSITSLQLASNAVTTVNIAPGAVTASQLASNTITAAQVAPGFGLVPTSGLVLSQTFSNPALTAAGYSPLFSVLNTNWTEATSAASWGARYGLRAAALNGQMWVMGGFVSGIGNSASDVWLSTNGIAWTQATGAAPWSPRFDFEAVPFNGRMWVMGGGGNAGFTNDVWSSTNGVNWTKATGAAPWTPRTTFAAVAFNGQLWVLGGGQLFSTPTNDVWSSSDGTNWIQVTSAAPWSARSNFRAVVFNGQMWVMGGGGLSDVWSSSNGVNWVQATSSAPWGPRTDFGAVAFNGQMWLMGGQGSVSGGRNDVWSSSDGVNWLQVTNAAPWGGRSSFGCTTFNNQMWVMGGFGDGAEVWSYPNVTINTSTNMLGSYYLFQKQ